MKSNKCLNIATNLIFSFPTTTSPPTHTPTQEFLRHKTVLLVTHQAHYLKQADRMVVMRDGEIHDVGSYQDLKARGMDMKALTCMVGGSRGCRCMLVTVNWVYFVRYYCSRMANQNFGERVFFANGQKAVTTEDGKYPKNNQNTRKRA